MREWEWPKGYYVGLRDGGERGRVGEMKLGSWVGEEERL